GGYAGNAVGFRIDSLLKLVDTRANKPRMNLLHYLVDVFGHKAGHYVSQMPHEFEPLPAACRYSMDTLTCEVNSLTTGLEKLKKQVLSAEDEIKLQFIDFLNNAIEECSELKKLLKEIQGLREELAVYLCEDVTTFKLEEIFTTINNFVDLVKQCQQDNKMRKKQEEKALEREKQQKLREQEKKQQNLTKQSVVDKTTDEDSCIIDCLLNDIAKGKFQSNRKRRTNKSIKKDEKNESMLHLLQDNKNDAMNIETFTTDSGKRRVRSRNTRTSRQKLIGMDRENPLQGH
ncbi:inverted formin-2-like, partial [Saccoglossus kowalevskii]|uniref:Inverted formin-2-like n=1 Tax=Saccoglossus kowalevskii TaxID=10224 RepID=A0ABM0MKQ7_SACKO